MGVLYTRNFLLEALAYASSSRLTDLDDLSIASCTDCDISGCPPFIPLRLIHAGTRTSNTPPELLWGGCLIRVPSSKSSSMNSTSLKVQIKVTELLPLSCVGNNSGFVNLYAVAFSSASDVAGVPRSILMLLEILGLFEDVFCRPRRGRWAGRR